MNKSITLTLCFTLLVATVGFSQKFGFCNSSALLTNIPEMKQADSELKSFQTQLQKRGQEMVKSLQDRAAELKRKEELGTISPKELEAQNAKLAADQAEIAAFEQEVYEKLAQKREQLFSPILERVNKAMSDVAKENGILFVFDSNADIVLYADESLDVTKLVKTKLNSE